MLSWFVYGLLHKKLAPVITSPGNFVLEELTYDHTQPLRYKMSNTRSRKMSSARPRNKTTFISDAKFSECLQNPNDLLQPVSVLLDDYIRMWAI